MKQLHGFKYSSIGVINLYSLTPAKDRYGNQADGKLWDRPGIIETSCPRPCHPNTAADKLQMSVPWPVWVRAFPIRPQGRRECDTSREVPHLENRRLTGAAQPWMGIRRYGRDYRNFPRKFVNHPIAPDWIIWCTESGVYVVGGWRLLSSFLSSLELLQACPRVC